MKVSKTVGLLTVCVTVLFLLIESGIASDDSGASLLPAGLVIETKYKPGFGEPAGKVLLVRGEVIIMHADEQIGYMAAEGLPLYKNDTVVTRPASRARLMLNDGSLLTLAPISKLVISRSVYEPQKKSRSTYIEQDGGKIRYWIKKLLGHNPSEFKVKTPTAVAGVRGSDFIITATATRTEVTTFENTELEVVSLAAPHLIPTRLSDFERTIVEAGALPSEVRPVTPEEVNQMMQSVHMAPGQIGPQAQINPDAGAAQASAPAEGADLNERETEGEKSKRQTEEGDEETPQSGVIIDNDVEAPLVLVPETELVMPEELTDISELEAQIPAPITEPGIIQDQEQAVSDQALTIMENVQEEIVELNRALPEFPGAP